MAGRGLWGLPTNQFLAHLIYSANLLFMQAVGWDLHAVFPSEFGLQLGSMTSSVGDWLNFTAHPQINSILFWLKIPHLIFDIGVFFVLNKIFSKHKNKLLILASWWLNPVNFYAFYIFSRHDVFTALSLLALLFFTAKNQIMAAILSLYAGIQIRVQPLLLAPVTIVQLWRQKASFIKLMKGLFIALSIISIYLLVIRSLSFNHDLYVNIVGDTTSSSPSAIGVPSRHIRQTFGTTLLGIPVFYSLYALIGVWWLIYSKKLKNTSFIIRFQEIIKISSVVMALYFAINPFSPHYYAWFSIFLSLSIAISPKVLKWYLLGVVGWLGMGLFSQDTTWFNQNLFVPISNAFFRTPSPAMLLQSVLSKYGLKLDLVYFLSRAVFSLGMIGFIWELYQDKVKRIGRILPVFALLCLLFIPKPVKAATIPVYEQPEAVEQVKLIDNPLEQSFISPVSEFGAIEIRLGTDRVPGSASLQFSIKEVTSDDDWHYTAIYDRADLYNGYYYPFGFPVTSNAKGKEFIFRLEQLDEPDLPIIAYINDSGEYSFTVLSNESGQKFAAYLKNELIQKIKAQQSFFIVYASLILLTSVLIVYVSFQKFNQDK